MGGSPNQGGFYSTPAFELFRRGLIIQTVKGFRGMNSYQSAAELGPEWALNCLNVLIPGWGGISKFRQPVQATTGLGGSGGPINFFDFQQPNGTRQLIADFRDGTLWYYTVGASTSPTFLGNPTQIFSGIANAFSMVEANNIMFMANGLVMRKWTGTLFQNWGIAAPPAFSKSPLGGPTATYGTSNPIASLSRATNVVTATITLGSGSVAGRMDWFPAVGDTISVANADASFNGDFNVASVNPATGVITWNQTGGNGSAGNPGLLILYAYVGKTPINSAVRTNGTVALTPLSPFNFQFGATGWQIGDTITVAGVADTSFNGTFVVTNASAVFLNYQQAGPDATSGNGSVGSSLSPTNGYTFAYAVGNQITGHVSNISPLLNLTQYTGPNRAFIFTVNPSAVDTQCGNFYVFRTLDGGGDLFQSKIVVTATTGVDTDTTPDPPGIGTPLNTTVQGPLINNPPPVGKYLAKGQGRVFIGNLSGAGADIAYSGYEQILLGRPEESFPPNNRLHLQIGASQVNGLGVLHHGIVAFSNTDRMYALRGQVEDITLNAPVNFSAYLEELPYTIGTLAHPTVVNTPYGLIFWATDKTVQMFNFGTGLQDISGAVYPILRQATPGSESLAIGTYFNWLERDWYALTFPFNGSTINNYTLFFALNKAAQQVDAFPTQINATETDCLGVVTTSDGQRLLCVGLGGQIFNLPVSQDTVNGISDNVTIPATSVTMPTAFWRSGYFGNDTPVRSRMWRKATLVFQRQTPAGGATPTPFVLGAGVVDNVVNPLAAPLFITPINVGAAGATSSPGSVSINARGTRISVIITFPQDDASCNVLELSLGRIDTSDRG